MIGLITARASIEILGKTAEKEDMIPVEFEETAKTITFKLKATNFTYRLIKQSLVFAINIPKRPFGREAIISELHEGMFEDKFKLTNLEKEECDTIDCPSIKNASVIECSILSEKQQKDTITIQGKILTTR